MSSSTDYRVSRKFRASKDLRASIDPSVSRDMRVSRDLRVIKDPRPSRDSGVIINPAITVVAEIVFAVDESTNITSLYITKVTKGNNTTICIDFIFFHAASEYALMKSRNRTHAARSQSQPSGLWDNPLARASLSLTISSSN